MMLLCCSRVSLNQKPNLKPSITTPRVKQSKAKQNPTCCLLSSSPVTRTPSLVSASSTCTELCTGKTLGLHLCPPVPKCSLQPCSYDPKGCDATDFHSCLDFAFELNPCIICSPGSFFSVYSI